MSRSRSWQRAAPRSERPRGGRGRGERGGRGRDRGDRPVRAPREPRGDRPPREPAPFIPAKPLEELSEKDRAVIEEAKAVLEELLRLMDLKGTVEIGIGSESAKLNVKGEELGVLIGRRGEKLASLQHLVNLIVAKSQGQYTRIAVDVENYRGRREEQLRDVAGRAAKRVIQTGKIIQLEPMPAIERRIVHMALVENAEGAHAERWRGAEPADRDPAGPEGRVTGRPVEAPPWPVHRVRWWSGLFPPACGLASAPRREDFGW